MQMTYIYKHKISKHYEIKKKQMNISNMQVASTIKQAKIKHAEQNHIIYAIQSNKTHNRTQEVQHLKQKENIICRLSNDIMSHSRTELNF